MSTSAKTAPPVIPILMPQAGNSMEEGTILQWRVQVGDRITPGQILFEVETDKASVDVEATDPGRIARIIAPEGAVIPIKHPVAYLAETDADLDAFLAEQSPESKTEKPQPETPPKPVAPTSAAPASPPPTTAGRIKASPAARKLATEKGLDLAQLPAGSGPGGRILSTDLASLQPAAHAAPVAYFRQTIDATALLSFQAQQSAPRPTLSDLILRAIDALRAQLPTSPAIVIADLSHLGIEEFAAALPPGLPAILAIGALREGVLASGGVMYARRILTLTLSADPRRIDNPLAAAFLTKLKQTLESPASHLP